MNKQDKVNNNSDTLMDGKMTHSAWEMCPSFYQFPLDGGGDLYSKVYMMLAHGPSK